MLEADGVASHHAPQAGPQRLSVCQQMPAVVGQVHDRIGARRNHLLVDRLRQRRVLPASLGLDRQDGAGRIGERTRGRARRRARKRARRRPVAPPGDTRRAGPGWDVRRPQVQGTRGWQHPPHPAATPF